MKIHGRITGIIAVGLLTTLLITGCDPNAGVQQSSGPNIPDVQAIATPAQGGTLTPVTPPTPPAEPEPTATPAATPVVTPAATPTATPIVNNPPPSSSLAGALGIHESVDLRTNDGPVVSQFGGTCSTFATAAAMDNVLHAKGINKLVSERHLWSTYGVYDADAAVEAASNHFLTEEQYWPINGSQTSTFASYASIKMTQHKNHDYNMESALQGLSQGHPLVMAIQVPSDLSYCKANVSATSGYTSGQHVVEAVGYQLNDQEPGGGHFILKNSWGSDCGDKGYHYYPFALCKRSDLYCYFIEVIDVI